MALSYKEILERREKRKSQELQFAMKRPKLPANEPATALAIMILQWAIDELYAEWRARELERAQATKEVIKPKPRGRGGRKNAVFEALGLA
jgi:hypothetical protein